MSGKGAKRKGCFSQPVFLFFGLRLDRRLRLVDESDGIVHGDAVVDKVFLLFIGVAQAQAHTGVQCEQRGSDQQSGGAQGGEEGQNSQRPTDDHQKEHADKVFDETFARRTERDYQSAEDILFFRGDYFGEPVTEQTDAESEQ